MKVLVILVIAAFAFTANAFSVDQTGLSEGDTELCTNCEKFFGYIKSTLEVSEGNATKALVKYMCGQFEAETTTYKLCSYLVMEYVPGYLKYVADLINPSMICTAIYFCPSNEASPALMNKDFKFLLKN